MTEKYKHHRAVENLKQRRYREQPGVRARQAANQRAYYARQGHRALVYNASRRAGSRGLVFTLPLEWAAGRTTCELTGLPFVKGSRLYAASIDRIDNSKGYTEDNCRLILRGLNMFKNDGCDADMYAIAQALINHRKDVQ